MLENDERNLQETRHIPNEVSTAHQENFLARENQETKTYSRAVTWNQFLRVSGEEG